MFLQHKKKKIYKIFFNNFVVSFFKPNVLKTLNYWLDDLNDYLDDKTIYPFCFFLFVSAWILLIFILKFLLLIFWLINYISFKLLGKLTLVKFHKIMTLLWFNIYSFVDLKLLVFLSWLILCILYCIIMFIGIIIILTKPLLIFFFYNIINYVIYLKIQLLNFIYYSLLFFLIKIKKLLFYLNIFDFNFLLTYLIFLSLTFVYFNKIYINKALSLYIYLILMMGSLVYFSLNIFIGFLIIVEMMTIIYIIITIFSFSNYYTFKHNQEKDTSIFLIIFLSITFGKNRINQYNIEDFYFIYYNFWNIELLNDFIGMYMYMYIDNAFIVLFLGFCFCVLSKFFIWTVSLFSLWKIRNFIKTVNAFLSIVFDSNVTFYEKHNFWEKHFVSPNSIFS